MLEGPADAVGVGSGEEAGEAGHSSSREGAGFVDWESFDLSDGDLDESRVGVGEGLSEIVKSGLVGGLERRGRLRGKRPFGEACCLDQSRYGSAVEAADRGDDRRVVRAFGQVSDQADRPESEGGAEGGGVGKAIRRGVLLGEVQRSAKGSRNAGGEVGDDGAADGGGLPMERADPPTHMNPGEVWAGLGGVFGGEGVTGGGGAKFGVVIPGPAEGGATTRREGLPERGVTVAYEGPGGEEKGSIDARQGVWGGSGGGVVIHCRVGSSGVMLLEFQHEGEASVIQVGGDFVEQVVSVETLPTGFGVSRIGFEPAGVVA